MPNKTIVDFANQVKSYALGIKDQQVLGAWNLCPNKYSATTGAGATWTENEDRSITVTGTNTTRATARIDCVIPKGHYWGSGCPAGGSSSTWQMNFQAQNPSVVNYFDNGNGVEFDLAEDTTFKVFCNLEQTGSEINKTFYPMISTQKAPYVPPAMTNRELTDAVTFGSFGSAVALTINTDYIAPSDGIFTIDCNPSGISKGYLNNLLVMQDKNTSDTKIVKSIYVKKGMTLKYSDGIGGYFIPIQP